MYASNMLGKYYKAFVPPKKVVKDFDLVGKIRCFKLPSEVGDHLLTMCTNDAPENEFCKCVALHLKDENDPILLDLGMCVYIRIYFIA